MEEVPKAGGDSLATAYEGIKSCYWC